MTPPQAPDGRAQPARGGRGRPAALERGLVERLGLDGFHERHEATCAWSRSQVLVLARRNRPDGSVVGVGLGERAEIDAAGRWTRRPFAPDERAELPVEEAGLSEAVVARLPDDVPMPPPPGA